MRLHAYLTRNGIRVDDFAVAIGVSSLSTVYRYLRGERVPRPQTIEKIRILTAGSVGAEDFLRSRDWWLLRQGRAATGPEHQGLRPRA